MNYMTDICLKSRKPADLGRSFRLSYRGKRSAQSEASHV